jgi:type IV secretion system protein VirD4
MAASEQSDSESDDENIWATDGGVYFGYKCQPPPDPDKSLDGVWGVQPVMNRYTSDRHLVTVGPNGSGKTRRLLIPNLYYLKNWSMVVVDPKGSLAALTGAYRAALPGHTVVVIDPFRVLEKNYPRLVERHPFLKSAGFNPVAALDPQSEDFEDDAKALADALIQIDTHGEKHWAQSAQSLVKGLLLVARLGLKDGRLPDLRYWLGMEPEALAEKIRGYKEGDKHVAGWAEQWRDTVPAVAASLSRFGKVSVESRELLSILSTAQTQTDWLDSGPVCADLAKGAFDFGSLKDRATTVYLILPPNRLATHSTWLRIMITAILTPLLRSIARAKVPVLMMLDEFAQLGHMPVIERNLGMMREYGVKLWPVFQDLAQAQDLYRTRWESFIGNAGILHSFAPQDVTTREYLSKLSGQRHYKLEVKTEGQSHSTGQNPSEGNSVNMGTQYVQGPVWWPQSLGLMEQGQGVLFSRGRAVRGLFPDPSKMPGVLEMLAVAGASLKAA